MNNLKKVLAMSLITMSLTVAYASSVSAVQSNEVAKKTFATAQSGGYYRTCHGCGKFTHFRPVKGRPGVYECATGCGATIMP